MDFCQRKGALRKERDVQTSKLNFFKKLSIPKCSVRGISVTRKNGKRACPHDQFLMNINGTINYACRNDIKH